MKEEKKLKKKAEDVAYRPGDGNLVGLIFFTPPPSPIIFRSVVSLDQLGTPFSRRGFVEMELLGQLKPTIQPTRTPYGDWLHLPSLDCKQHGDQRHL